MQQALWFHLSAQPVSLAVIITKQNAHQATLVENTCSRSRMHSKFTPMLHLLQPNCIWCYTTLSYKPKGQM